MLRNHEQSWEKLREILSMLSILRNADQCWLILRNTEESWAMLNNWAMLINATQYWGILNNAEINADSNSVKKSLCWIKTHHLHNHLLFAYQPIFDLSKLHKIVFGSWLKMVFDQDPIHLLDNKRKRPETEPLHAF